MCSDSFIYSYKNIQNHKNHIICVSIIHTCFLFVLTRRVEMMHNPKRLCLCYFLTLAHSVSVILSLYMTREGLGKKAAMSYPFFHFLTVIFSVNVVGYYKKGTPIRRNLIEWLDSLSFLDCLFFFYIRIKFCDLIGKCGFSGLLAYPLTQP